MSIIYSANDYKILFTLFKNECTNEIKAFTINKIKKETNLSIPKIRTTIKAFIKEGYIKKGVSHHNANSYYVSETGIKKIKELKG